MSVGVVVVVIAVVMQVMVYANRSLQSLFLSFKKNFR